MLSDSWNHFRCRIFLFFPIFLDIDECQKNTHDCHLNATCQNTNGSFVCTCLFGFNGDGRNCTGSCLVMTLRNVISGVFVCLFVCFFFFNLYVPSYSVCLFVCLFVLIKQLPLPNTFDQWKKMKILNPTWKQKYKILNIIVDQLSLW